MVVSIAVIGCGPGGMSFCHAAERLGGESLSITCFERSSSPGGVWKAANPAGKDGDTVNMYAALWTNGPSHGTEYFDYTYDEHFQRPVTVYMPRQEVLGYMIGRVTKNCPNFFEKYVQFDTEVVNVVFDQARNRFDITLRSHKSNKTVVRHFDKCVWACGENSKQNVPDSLRRLFEEGGFQGRLIHSADTANLKEDVHKKRVLLIGGGYSAEDLALQAIKLGVEKLYVSTRSGDSSYVGAAKAWPMNKVQVLSKQLPCGLSEDGRCIHFKKVSWKWPDGYKVYKEESGTIRDIDTVIFCTGYNANFDMLDESLRKGYPRWSIGGYELEVPDTWKMPDNVFTKDVGKDVRPGKVFYNVGYTHPEFYRGVLVSNPSMMFITIYDSYFPLLAVDTCAWMLVGFLTGRIPLPTTPEEMQRRTQDQALTELKQPYLRYYMDSNYYSAVNDTWNDETQERYNKAAGQYYEYAIKLLARDMEEAKYPFSLGNYQELNGNGRALLTFNSKSSAHRYRLDDKYMEKHPWSTFRDYDDAEEFYSLFTGTKAVKLQKKWLDIDLEAENKFEFVEERKN